MKSKLLAVILALVSSLGFADDITNVRNTLIKTCSYGSSGPAYFTLVSPQTTSYTNTSTGGTESSQRIILKNILFSTGAHGNFYLNSSVKGSNVKVIPQMFLEAGTGMNSLAGRDLNLITQPGGTLEAYFSTNPDCDIMIEYAYINT